jgi:hypothetical protein
MAARLMRVREKNSTTSKSRAPKKEGTRAAKRTEFKWFFLGEDEKVSTPRRVISKIIQK